MDLVNYVDLINNLGEVYTHYASYCNLGTWENILEDDGLIHELFPEGPIIIEDNEYYVVSRNMVQQFIEDHEHDEIIDVENLREAYLLILMWGYPSGNHGHVQHIINDDELIVNFHDQVINGGFDTLAEYYNEADNNHFPHIGPSTFTKFFYFFSHWVNHAVILDSMMIKIINDYSIDQFADIPHIGFSAAGYQTYCNCMNDIAGDLGIVDVDYLEYFLFAIARHMDCVNLP